MNPFWGRWGLARGLYRPPPPPVESPPTPTVLWLPLFTLFLRYHEIIVPTPDTARYAFLLKAMVTSNSCLMLVGDTGTGKSLLVRDVLINRLSAEQYLPIMLQFSAQTTALQTQEILESKLEKRRKGVYAPPIGKRAVVCQGPVLWVLTTWSLCRRMRSQMGLGWGGARPLVKVPAVAAPAPPATTGTH